jgi:protein TonB
MSFSTWQRGIALILALGLHAVVLVSVNFSEPGVTDVGLEGFDISVIQASNTEVFESDTTDEVIVEEAEVIEIVEEIKAIEVEEIEPKVIAKEVPIIQVKKKPPVEKKVVEMKMVAKEAPKNNNKATESTHKVVAKTSQGMVSNFSNSQNTEASYKATISALLKKYKKYPKRALSRRQEGTVTVLFTIQKDGSLLSYKIKNSSGHKLLDKAVEKMLKKAVPLPPFPNNMKQESITLVLPVDFYIRS